MPSKSKTNLACLVCGEQATGYNFCAITCQSCKAFFRRNAFKYEKYKCRFKDECLINQKSRRLCKKCRLKKSFAVGMKKEWILNDEEKRSRRHQIEENRKKKKRQFSDKQDITTDTDDDIVSTSTADIIVDTISDLTTDLTIDDEINEFINEISILDTNNDQIIDTTDTSNDASITSIQDQIEDILTKTSCDLWANNGHEKSGPMAVQVFECRAMDKMNTLNSFNDYECKRLNELFNLSMFNNMKEFKSTWLNTDQVYWIELTAEYIMNSSAQKFDENIQKLIASVQQLQAFQSMCLNDQVALVKSSCVGIALMKCGPAYSPVADGLTFPLGNNTRVIFPLNSLKQLKTDVYNQLKYYFNTFISEFDADICIIQLLVPIILFNPNRPNVIQKDVVELQHQLYLYLLQRYLRIKYGSDYESKYSILSHIIQNILILNDLHKQNLREVKSEYCGPLLKEVLDLPSNDIN